MDSIGLAGARIHWLTARDGTRLRAAHWPGPGSAILLLNGRTEFIEKHLEAVSELTARGHAVWTLDWRGQGLSDRSLPDPARNHVLSLDQHLADLDLLVRTLAPGRPLTLLGLSMGGHLALRYLAQHPQTVGRAVLCAPMIDFPRPRGVSRLGARALAATLCLLPGQAARFGPGTTRIPDPDRPFDGNLLTSCRDRFAADQAWLRNPALAVGGATWGWLRSATASIGVLHRRGFAERIAAPVLMVLAGADGIVDNAAARRFARRLPHAELLEINGARHEILRERDAYRERFWSAFDRFMAQAGKV